MQRLEVSVAVRHIYMSLGFKRLKGLIGNLPTALFTPFGLMPSFQSFCKVEVLFRRLLNGRLLHPCCYSLLQLDVGVVYCSLATVVILRLRNLQLAVFGEIRYACLKNFCFGIFTKGICSLHGLLYEGTKPMVGADTCWSVATVSKSSRFTSRNRCSSCLVSIQNFIVRSLFIHFPPINNVFLP